MRSIPSMDPEAIMSASVSVTRYLIARMASGHVCTSSMKIRDLPFSTLKERFLALILLMTDSADMLLKTARSSSMFMSSFT